jgi:predicted Zn finger-like uncharacterized protein
MNVQCPHCSTAYLLPEHLLGPKGARVRCPKCQGTFDVPAQHAGSTSTSSPPGPAPAAATASDARPLAPASERASAAALEAPAIRTDGTAHDLDASAQAVEAAALLLDELSSRLGERLEQAVSQGRVLSEFGPSVMDAYAEYRRRLGAQASAAAFREALRLRWSLDLNPRRDSAR